MQPPPPSGSSSSWHWYRPVSTYKWQTGIGVIISSVHRCPHGADSTITSMANTPNPLTPTPLPQIHTLER